jgi:hypothetical protein
MRDNESETQPASSDGEQDPTDSRSTNGNALDVGADSSDATANSTADDSAVFLADLARVMQSAAAAERLRITEDGDRRRNAHLELIRARETSEAEQLKMLAESDIKAIDSWADTEIERIQSERDRRITSRRGELEGRLEDHRLLIGREVDAVEEAIAAYRTEVEAYFSRLDAETDPVVIAREAGRRPRFPALGTFGSESAAANTATVTADEAGGTGDDGSPPAGDAQPVASVEPDGGAEPRDELGEPAETKGEEVETTVASNAVAPRSSGALMGSWFRRGDDPGGRPEADG